MTKPTHRRLEITLTDRTLELLNHVSGSGKQGAFIEYALWNTDEIRQASMKLGLPRIERRSPGRPKEEE